MLNKLFVGDCLEQFQHIEPNSIDLIYLDPPFFSEKKHKLKSRDGKSQFSFDDVWKTHDSYTDFLFTRIVEMKALLKETGSIFVHCDKSADHIVKAILEQVFGRENFQSEIIWSYKRWSNGKRGLLPNHQNIYFYSKSKQFKFNTILTDYSATTNVDQILQKRRRSKDNKSVYDLDEQGDFKHADEKKGVPLSDVWDIPYLNPKAKERVGYPTQKPLLLLERIIELVTDENDVVLDPFCGSGTTCVAAMLKGRQYIGIDQSEQAIELTKSRLAAPVKTESIVTQHGRDAYKTADDTVANLLNGVAFNPVHRNKGIDAILVEQYQNAPVLVRAQKQRETLEQSLVLLQKAMKVKKSQKSFLIQTFADDQELVDLPSNITLLKSPALLVKAALS